MEKQIHCPGATGHPRGSHGCVMDFNQANMMPLLPNRALEEAAKGLPTAREVSSIERDDGEKWVYPSPMQFYNALVLKNKTNPDDAPYIPAAVMAHNQVNERSWERVLEWEKRHFKTCPHPNLRRFVGKYDHTSPKSLINRYIFRMGKPFDRHDWYVNRCGREVRYVIDYYDDPKATDDIQVYIDARPALDSPGSFFDRIRALFSRN
ncbi:cytochrome c/c1 heme lyase like protein [Babesia gibsoni]|uniref:Holocytochrome c-type synthase n=1 Tax=Babesia gibsoni TaxID=33632 RepID=A0AAD8PEY8_BABGI|nr:cytochrome c/c1 heme lyase like protein [Babesia gibsoni]